MVVKSSRPWTGHLKLGLITKLCCVIILGKSVSSLNLNQAKRHADHGKKKFCDDGKTNIEIDLNGDSDWKCPSEKWKVHDMVISNTTKACYDEEPAYHVCVDRNIDNLYGSNIPHSGPHRAVWAQFGEYNYLPPGRYVHNLEHGGVVFMYHPCTPDTMVDSLRKVANSCLYRYILTAFPNLTMEYPIAVVTYGCILRLSRVDPFEIKSWVREQFGGSPESDEYGNGQYNFGLLHPSVEPENYSTDSDTFCPDLEDKPELQQNPVDVTSNTDGNSLLTVPSKKISKMLLAICGLLALVILLITGIYLIKLCRKPTKDEIKSIRTWNDSHNPDSVTVASFVRKIPRPGRSKKKSYHLIVDSANSSTEEDLA